MPASVLEIDLATLARTIREQKALPLSDDEAEQLAVALERSADDEDFLGNAVEAVRLIARRIDSGPNDV